jgi:hypothetical protein
LVQIFHDKDADLKVLKDKTIAIGTRVMLRERTLRTPDSMLLPPTCRARTPGRGLRRTA